MNNDRNRLGGIANSQAQAGYGDPKPPQPKAIHNTNDSLSLLIERLEKVRVSLCESMYRLNQEFGVQVESQPAVPANNAALANGADGIACKIEGVHHMIDAIEAIAAGINRIA